MLIPIAKIDAGEGLHCWLCSTICQTLYVLPDKMKDMGEEPYDTNQTVCGNCIVDSILKEAQNEV